MKLVLSALAAIAVSAAAPNGAGAAAATASDAARALVEQRLRPLLSSPQVVDAVKAQNRRTVYLAAADIEALDRRWRLGDPGLIEPTLRNRLSSFLAGLVAEGRGAFSEISVMDARGLNVGQSAKTPDYWQGDEAKWRLTYMVGPDAVHVSEIERNEATQTLQVEVSMSITHGGAPIGAVTVGVDLTHLE